MNIIRKEREVLFEMASCVICRKALEKAEKRLQVVASLLIADNLKSFQLTEMIVDKTDQNRYGKISSGGGMHCHPHYVIIIPYALKENRILFLHHTQVYANYWKNKKIYLT